MHRRRQRFVFASEIKAVFAHGGVDTALDLQALDEVFTFWAPVAPRTCFAQVKELPPGHCLSVKDGRVRTWRYWAPDFSEATRMGEDEAAQRLLELLTDASRIRLRSDVPVGAYLSGGLDSSVITALVNGIAGTRLRTFSVTFDDAHFDESHYQQAVVEQLGRYHQSIRCSYDDICAVLSRRGLARGETAAAAAPAPLFLLSKLVRDACFKVVLTGEGADEFLGGYDIFKEAKIRRFWARQPESQCRPLLLRKLYPYMPELRAQSDAYRKSFFRVGPQHVASPFFSHLPRWTVTARAKQFFSEGLRAQLASADAVCRSGEAVAGELRALDRSGAGTIPGSGTAAAGLYPVLAGRPHGDGAFGSYTPQFHQMTEDTFTLEIFNAVNVHPLPDTFYLGRYQMGNFMSKELRLKDLRDFCLATYPRNKPVVMDEDNAASLYRDNEGWTIHRKRAWTTLMCGSHYDYIDFSITAGQESGTEESRTKIRTWMKNLSTFFQGVDFIHSMPLINWLEVESERIVESVLALPNEEYLIYLADARELADPQAGKPIETILQFPLSAGVYDVRLYSPGTGMYSPAFRLESNGWTQLPLPAFEQDLLVIVQKDTGVHL